MGKENVNQNFNHTVDTGGLTANQQEIKMNVNGAINVHANTQGVNVEKSDVKQNVNHDVKTQLEQTTQVQTSTHVGEVKTVDTKQDVTDDVQTNSKIPVNDVNTGEILKESRETAGLNHTQTVLGQDVTTKQEKMDSSNVEHVSVSDETKNVGSYSDDAKNNGVFGIDAQRGMNETKDRANVVSTKLSTKQFTSSSATIGASTKIKLNTEELISNFRTASDSLKYSSMTAASSQKIALEIIKTVAGLEVNRKMRFSDNLGSLLDKEIERDKLHSEIHNMLFCLFSAGGIELKSEFKDVAKVYSKEKLMQTKTGKNYEAIKEMLEKKMKKTLTEIKNKMEKKVADKVVKTTALKALSKPAYLSGVLTALAFAIDLVTIAQDILNAATLAATLNAFYLGGETLALVCKGIDANNFEWRKIDQVILEGKMSATGINDPVVKWAYQQTSLINLNMEVLSKNMVQLSDVGEKIAEKFKQMDNNLSSQIAKGNSHDINSNISSWEFEELNVGNHIIDKNLDTTVQNQMNKITIEVCNIAQEELSNYYYLSGNLNQDAQKLLKHFEDNSWLVDKLKWYNESLENTANTALNWVPESFKWIVNQVRDLVLDQVKFGADFVEFYDALAPTKPISKKINEYSQKINKLNTLIYTEVPKIVREASFDVGDLNRVYQQNKITNDEMKKMQITLVNLFADVQNTSESNAYTVLIEKGTNKMTEETEILMRQFDKIQ